MLVALLALSAILLSGCNTQSGYDAGYEAGKTDGYGSGYADGEIAGYAEGYSKGKIDGLAEGYDLGYAAGKADGESGGYDKGYDEGRVDGESTGYNNGYLKGKADGLKEGYDAGYVAGKADSQPDIYDDGYSDGYTDGKSDGHTDGYDEGYSAGQDSMKSYIVSFYVDGKVYATAEKSEGKEFEMPDEPKKAGYGFSGWYWDSGIWKMPFSTGYLTYGTAYGKGNVYAKFDVSSGEETGVHSDDLIINQIYGIGSKNNDNQAGSNSFVELYNPTDTDISLSGYSLHAASAGTEWDQLNLSGTIKARHSFLVILTEYTNSSAKLNISNYDMQWLYIAFSNKNLKVALMSNTRKLSVANPFTAGLEGYVDMIGIAGNDSLEPIDGYETAYHAEQSKQKAARRKGFTDTDNNAADIEIIDYRTADLDNCRPRSSHDGAWYGSVELVPSVLPGMYNADFQLMINNMTYNPDLEIRYTVDGTEPDISSHLYTPAGITISDNTALWANQPLTSRAADFLPTEGVDGMIVRNQRPLDDAETLRGTTVRYKAFIGGSVASVSETCTYIVAPDINERYAELPIISVTAPEDEFLDMYINYADEIEYTFNYEYFDFDDDEGGYKQVFSLPGSTKIGGQYTRIFGQKTLNVNLSKADLSGNVTYPILDGVGNLKRFRLWSGGNMFQFSEFVRDLYIQRSIKEVTNVPVSEGRPVITFINGEYWGFCHLRENYSKDYAETHFGTDKNNFAQIKSVSEVIDDIYCYPHVVDDGDEETVMALYDDMLAYILSEGFDYDDFILDYFDEDNLIDYIVVNTFYANYDWPHNNIRMYRAIVPQENEGHNDGKWRFFLHDADFGGWTGKDADIFSFPVPKGESAPEFNALFTKLFGFDNFKQKMYDRAYELVTGIFDSERTTSMYSHLTNAILPLREEMNGRYRTSLTTPILSDNFKNIFLTERPAIYLAQIEKYCNMAVNP